MTRRRANKAKPPIEQVAVDQRQKAEGFFYRLECAREAFSEPQWDLLCLLYRDGLRQVEAAHKRGTSPGAVSRLKDRALESFRAWELKAARRRIEFLRQIEDR